MDGCNQYREHPQRAATSNTLNVLAGFGGKSRMSGDVYVRFHEHLRGWFRQVTRRVVSRPSRELLQSSICPTIRRFMAVRGQEGINRIFHTQQIRKRGISR
ncbi:hypothetical protein LMG29542_08113 [Paraburkholderia humisilvae]|uniref:Uncharacterized protein n=1 Tax=Paraburkholderia humisilvae TaxID=627669 RepID=A0A6J5FBX8_9BURK|nr:hypothetical protein LMG29542_08113 [Paraburkholderia humisilvae]